MTFPPDISVGKQSLDYNYGKRYLGTCSPSVPGSSNQINPMSEVLLQSRLHAVNGKIHHWNLLSEIVYYRKSFQENVSDFSKCCPISAVSQHSSTSTPWPIPSPAVGNIQVSFVLQIRYIVIFPHPKKNRVGLLPHL